MARSLDIETLIEDAFLSNMPSYLDSDVTVKSWDDIKTKELAPLVKVKAQMTDDVEGTMNLYAASNILVDFGIFTSKQADEDGRDANGIRGDLRDLLNQDDLVDVLNAEPGLFVYKNGVIPQTSTNIQDGKMWHKAITILVVATTVSTT